MANYKGAVKARIIEVRFALSGKIASVQKHSGDKIKKWDLVASLDRKMLQTELDSKLSDYEKVRADFEIFGQKNPNPTETIDKYLKTQKNAELNGSVKDVELAKARLDQAGLFCPVNGIVMDDSGIVPGLYVTPASASIKIIDSDSFYVEVELDEKDIKDFRETREAKINFQSELVSEITGQSTPVLSDAKKFYIKIPVSADGLLLGLTADVSI